MFKDTFNDILNKKGISIYRLSKDTGIAYSALQGYLTGRISPTKSTLERLSGYLGISADELAKQETNEEQEETKKIFFSIAQEAAASGLGPEDVKTAIEIFEKYGKKK